MATREGYCDSHPRCLYCLSTVTEDAGHFLLTFLVLGMIGVKVGQGLQGIDETRFWSLWRSAPALMAKE